MEELHKQEIYQYLTQQNKRNQGIEIKEEEIIATDKNVVVIGSGDTGADCIRTAIRQGAKKVYQFGRSGKCSEKRNNQDVWPIYPMKFKNIEAYEEGGIREYSVKVTAFSGENGKVNKLHAVRIDEEHNEIEGSEFELECDLVLFAMGFLHPEHEDMLKDLKVDLDERGNVLTDDKFRTSVEGIYSAGDMRRGQSLVAHAISEGRKAAKEIDLYLMGNTNLK